MKYNIHEWKLVDVYEWMDGGSITINFVDKCGETNTIEIVQNVTIGYYVELSKIPGRIYVNSELLDKRSKDEKVVIVKLKNIVENEQSKLNLKILTEKIKWIESTSFLELNPIVLELSERRKRQLLTDKLT